MLLATCCSLFPARCFTLIFCVALLSAGDRCSLQADCCSARFEFPASSKALLPPYCRVIAICSTMLASYCQETRFSYQVSCCLRLHICCLLSSSWFGFCWSTLFARYFLLCCLPLANFYFKFAVRCSLLEARCHYALLTAYGLSGLLVVS